MENNLALLMMTYLIVKHFICDFPLRVQTPWMFMNKGTYGHPGGIVHALIHISASAPLFWWLMSWMHRGSDFLVVSGILIFEFLVHYHMDWFKMWLAKNRGWSNYLVHSHPPHLAIYSNAYFLWLGIDQLVHYLTYIVMVAVWLG